MKVLVVGDIVGSPGRAAFERIAGRMKQSEEVDFIVVNGENAAGGRGITPSIVEELIRMGADVITMGDHTWDQKDIVGFIDSEPRLIRPANFSVDCPGKGWVTVETETASVTVINLIGRVFMGQTPDCPFRMADEILSNGKELGTIRIVDMHAEATSEKIALGRYLDGRVSAVVGTHTHVQTSDETILPEGTGYLTDMGMTGPKDSVLGRDVQSVLNKFLTGMPTRFSVAKEQVMLEGVIFDIDEKNGKARHVERIRKAFD